MTYVAAAACLNNHGVDAMCHDMNNRSFELLLEALQLSKMCFLSQAQQQKGRQEDAHGDAERDNSRRTRIHSCFG